MSTRNEDMPKSTTSASRLYGHSEASRSWYGKTVRNRVTQKYNRSGTGVPQLTSWTRAETLASHGSDFLSVVICLQKPGIEPRRRPQYPFKYDKSDMGVMSKLRACKPAHTTNPRQKAVIQPPWLNRETQSAWTNKQGNGDIVANRKKQATPRPDYCSSHGRKDRSVQESGWWSKRQAVEELLWHSQQRRNCYSPLAILPTDGELRCEHDLPPPPPSPHRPHRCQWRSTEDKQGKGLSTTPTLRPEEESK